MDFSRSSLASRWRGLWNSERAWPLRFYGGYFRWPLLLVLLALAGEKLIFYGGLPLAGYARREWNYRQAECDFAAGRDRPALIAIRRALLETRDNARLWRLAARISDRLDSSEAAYCWLQADRLDPGSTAIELALAEAALAHGQLELAHDALQEIAPDQQAGARYALDAGRLAQADAEPARARYWFAQVEAARTGDAHALLIVATWHGGQPDAADQARARDLLAKLAQRPAVRLAALRALVALDLRQHNLASARTDGAALLATPEATFADRVTHLDVADDGGSPDTELAELLQTGSPAKAAQVLDWMTAHDRAEKALIWIRHQDESWQDSAAIGEARAHCLVALGDWAHLRDDQRDSVWPGHESTRLRILAQASLALGAENDARAAWQQAVAACATPEDFAQLDLAADSLRAPHGWADEKAEVWRALANRFPGREQPLRALLAYQLGRGDLVAAQELAQRLATLEPRDPALRANSDLISLLRGNGTGQSAADLRRLVQLAPDNPAVATAAAYALYLQGRFDDALATLGALDPATLDAPERAAYLGQLLAAAGPVDQAEAVLKTAQAQPNLLETQRAGIGQALDLVAYRRAMADLLHGRDETVRARARDFFITHAATGNALFSIGESVTLASDPDRAATLLARIDPATLDQAGESLDEGAALLLAGQSARALPLLELAGGRPVESSAKKWHRAVEAWWTQVDRAPDDAALMAALLAAYRGLELHEPAAAFWQRDEAREMKLTRTALQHAELAGAVQLRIEALARRVPTIPEIEAQIGYALFLQGRPESGRERLEVLSPAELRRPEPARYYAAILRACGEPKRAQQVMLDAGLELAGRKSP